ncbi:hypothetical protein [Dipodfec virus UOA04_Rod_754]|nr:hypothetical protein [Dipodfec virus UOA04_Rod_754]
MSRPKSNVNVNVSGENDSLLNPRPIRTGLIQQNCFIRDFVRLDVCDTPVQDSYMSLDEEVTSQGVKLVETVHDYPITPEYVDSFVDCADYRRDPASAVANAPTRQNLGDIVDLQKASKMSLSDAAVLLNQLQKKFASVSAKKETSVSAKKETSVSVEKSEKVDN